MRTSVDSCRKLLHTGSFVEHDRRNQTVTCILCIGINNAIEMDCDSDDELLLFTKYLTVLDIELDNSVQQHATPPVKTDL